MAELTLPYSYRFGRFEMQPSERRLLAAGEPAEIGARAFDVLVALVERAGKLVTKGELLELVWPNLVVEENNLQVQVSALRKILGTDAIATIAGKGYRLTLQLKSAADPGAFYSLKKLLVPFDENTPSIAVLPFVNISRDEENEYFADGLAEELLNVLSKIRGLRVASRTSAFSFKGAKVDIPTVARKLNVATILEGSVRRAGKRVRITAQLVHAATDSHLWSETYDRELEDIFAVQDDIAQSVVRQLRTALLAANYEAPTDTQVAEEVSTAANGRGGNVEAYQWFLQARFFIDRFTCEDIEKGVELLRRALAVEPDFALGWAGLARAFEARADYEGGTTTDGWHQAREAAKRALELAPNLVEGHLALASVLMHHDFDWKAADAAIQRALTLAPSHALALGGAARLALVQGRLDEAVMLSRHVVALDPLSVGEHRALAWRSLFAGHLEEAEEAIQKAIALSPSAGLLHLYFGLVRLAQDRPKEALAAFNLEALHDARTWGVAVAQYALGRLAESDAALEVLLERYASSGAYHIATAYAFRGEVDRAFLWLERSYAQRDTALAYLKPDRLLGNLHSDPRWRPFLAKMGLVD